MFGASKFQFSYLKASFAVVYPPSESFLVVEKLTIGSALLCFNHCTAPAVDDSAPILYKSRKKREIFFVAVFVVAAIIFTFASRQL